MTLREREVRDLVVKGLSNNEIAQRLFITEKCVKFHITNILKEEGVTSRARLIVKHLSDGVTSNELKMFREVLK